MPEWKNYRRSEPEPEMGPREESMIERGEREERERRPLEALKEGMWLAGMAKACYDIGEALIKECPDSPLAEQIQGAFTFAKEMDAQAQNEGESQKYAFGTARARLFAVERTILRAAAGTEVMKPEEGTWGVFGSWVPDEEENGLLKRMREDIDKVGGLPFLEKYYPGISKKAEDYKDWTQTAAKERADKA